MSYIDSNWKANGAELFINLANYCRKIDNKQTPNKIIPRIMTLEGVSRSQSS